jgi:hypothetical protein
MLINSYGFGRAPGGNIPTLLQNTIAFKIDNSTTNTSLLTMTINTGSTVIVVIHHMMLNGNNDSAICSDNVQATGYAVQVKSVCGTSGGSSKRGSVEIRKSDVFTTTDLGGAQGDVKITIKSADTNIANIRMHYYALEVANLANGDLVIGGSDVVAINLATNAGNNSPNVFMSGWSSKNSFVIAAATGLQANQFSFNTSPYPGASDGSPGTWLPLWIKNEASGTATGNTRSISNYMISSQNAAQIISDWTPSYNSTPWAAVIASFPAS